MRPRSPLSAVSGKRYGASLAAAATDVGPVLSRKVRMQAVHCCCICAPTLSSPWTRALAKAGAPSTSSARAQGLMTSLTSRPSKARDPQRSASPKAALGPVPLSHAPEAVRTSTRFDTKPPLRRLASPPFASSSQTSRASDWGCSAGPGQSGAAAARPGAAHARPSASSRTSGSRTVRIGHGTEAVPSPHDSVPASGSRGSGFAGPQAEPPVSGGECRGSKPTCVGLDGTNASRLWRLAPREAPTGVVHYHLAHKAPAQR